MKAFDADGRYLRYGLVALLSLRENGLEKCRFQR